MRPPETPIFKPFGASLPWAWICEDPVKIKNGDTKKNKNNETFLLEIKHLPHISIVV